MMFLYLFKPTDYWHYCGGCVVIMAHTWEECVKVWEEGQHGEDGSLRQLEWPSQPPDLEGGYDWILYRTYGLSGCDNLNPSIELVEYNYA